MGRANGFLKTTWNAQLVYNLKCQHSGVPVFVVSFCNSFNYESSQDIASPHNY
jgi:hypothetical protein